MIQVSKSAKETSFFDVDDLLSKQNEILSRIEDLTEAQIKALNAVEGIDVEENIDPAVVQYEYSRNIPSNSSLGDVPVTRTAPFSGKITSIVVGWPDGTANAVGVQLRREDSGGTLFPNNPGSDVIAANDFTTDFDAGFSVGQGERIIADFINNDPNNSHFVNMIVEFKEDI